MSSSHSLAELVADGRPFTCRRALGHGVSRGRLAAALREGSLRRVLTDVYVASEAPDTVETRAEATALVLDAHAVLVDRTAAWLWGVDCLSVDESTGPPPRLEVFVLRGHKRVIRSQAGGGERDLAPRDVCRIGRVQVTTPLRTSLDLGCRLSRYEGLATMDAFAREHSVVSWVLQRELPRFRRRRGVVQVRQLVPLVDPRSESTGESFTRLAIIDAGLPVPVPQHWVGDGGLRLYRLDLAYPRHRICVEYDGLEHHSAPYQRRHDQDRRRWLEAQGWTVIVVTREGFGPLARDRWLGQLRQALAASPTMHEGRLNEA
jgi:hypothetical protein